MPHLPTRLPKLLGLAASAALGLIVFTGVPAEAAPGQGLNGVTASGLPVEQAHYYRRYYRGDYAYRDYPADYNYSYRGYGHGHYEIRELQRLFPSTNWPYSMRYDD
jgi:hypothetical protein